MVGLYGYRLSQRTKGTMRYCSQLCEQAEEVAYWVIPISFTLLTLLDISETCFIYN